MKQTLLILAAVSFSALARAADDLPVTSSAGESTQVAGGLSLPIDGPFIDECSPAARIAAECRTGSLLFSRGDCLAVRVYTGSGFTHVATVVCCVGEPVVYDCTNGVGVRRLPLCDYLAVQRPDELHLFHPRREFTDEEAQQFAAALEHELGRPYSAKHFLTGRRCAGLHCSEYVTDALISIGWLRAENPVRVSPASLLTGIVVHGVYTAGSTVELTAELTPTPEPQTWCGQLWWSTKRCTTNCCRQLMRWFWCR